MNERKILIVDDLHATFKERAEKMGYQCDDEPLFTKEQALAVIADYEGLAIRTKFRVDQQLIDTATKLKFIARAGAGMDNIDEEYVQSKKIVCINAPEGNRDAVAEHAMAMLLSLMNILRKADLEVRKGVWDREGNRGWELCGKTVAIIGYGNTGQCFAKKLSGFDVEVIAYDKYKTGFSSAYAKEVSMEQVVKYADILSFHIPLTRETRQLVNDEYLFHFKKPIFLLNTARGEIINTQSVLNAIKRGKILGAGLDVLEVEGFPALAKMDWYAGLVQSEQVLLSPHVAGWTLDSYRKISEVLADKLEEIDF